MAAHSYPVSKIYPADFDGTLAAGWVGKRQEEKFLSIYERVMEIGMRYEQVYMEMLRALRELFSASVGEGFQAIPALEEFLAVIGERRCGAMCELWLPGSFKELSLYLLEVSKSLSVPHIMKVMSSDWYTCEPSMSEFELRWRELKPVYAIIQDSPEGPGFTGDDLMIESYPIRRRSFETRSHWVMARGKEGMNVLFLMSHLPAFYDPSELGCPIFTWGGSKIGQDLRPMNKSGHSVQLIDFCSLFGWNMGFYTCLQGERFHPGDQPGKCACSKRYLRWEAETLNYLVNQGNLFRAISKITTDETLSRRASLISSLCVAPGHSEDHWKETVIKSLPFATIDIVGSRKPLPFPESWSCMFGKITWVDLEDERFIGRLAKSGHLSRIITTQLEHGKVLTAEEQGLGAGGASLFEKLVQVRVNSIDRKLMASAFAKESEVSASYPPELAKWGTGLLHHRELMRRQWGFDRPSEGEDDF